MGKTAQRVVAALIGVMLLIWGIFSLAVSRKLIEDLDIYTGALEVVQPACDPEFGVKADSPYLERVVAMYQYYENKDGGVDTGFFTTKQSVRQKKNQPAYENPAFPENIQNEIFYGEVTIGDQKIFLDPVFLLKFSLDKYADFEDENKSHVVEDISDTGEVDGFHLVDGEYYTNGKENDWQVGDLKVYWLAMDPHDFADTYTAAGQLQANKLGAKDTAYEFLYDRELTSEEIQDRFAEENQTSAIILLVLGAAIIVLAIIPRKNKVY
jgi:hypothetical protein